MREVSTEAKSAIFSRFVAVSPSITVIVDPENFDLVDIPAGRIIDNSMRIDYALDVSDKIKFGTVTAPDLTAEIRNDDGLYDRIDFVGKELRVYASLNVTGTPESVTMGRFICDSAQRHGDNIVLRALGIITKLDKTYHTGDIQFPIAAWNLAVALCNLCGMQVKSPDESDYVKNGNLLIKTEPDDGKYTCRQLLNYVCEIMAVSAQTRAVDGTEKVVLRWYGDADYYISKANCFALEYDKDAPALGRVFVASEQYSNAISLGGDSNCEYRVINNPIVLKMNSGNASVVSVSSALADNGYGIAFNSRAFRPKAGKAEILPNPLLEPLDALYYKDEFGLRGFDLYVCSVAWRPNRNTELVFAGYKKKETDDTSPFTQEQETVLSSLQTKIGKTTEDIAEIQSAVLSAQVDISTLQSDVSAAQEDVATLQSQVQSISVDYVVENGISGNWTWRKWNSGILEMWGYHLSVRFDTTADGEVNWRQAGSTGFSWASGSFNFPQTFYDKTYTMNISKEYDPDAKSSNLLIYGSVHQSTTQGGVRVLIPTDQTAGLNTTRLDVHVSGRWKAAT